MNLFQRAAQNLNLSAAERGIYHFWQLMLFSLGPVGAWPFVSDLVKSANGWLATGTWVGFDYLGDLRLLGVMLLGAALAALQHYRSSRADPPLATTTSGSGSVGAPSADVSAYFRSGASMTPPPVPPQTPPATPAQ